MWVQDCPSWKLDHSTCDSPGEAAISPHSSFSQGQNQNPWPVKLSQRSREQRLNRQVETANLFLCKRRSHRTHGEGFAELQRSKAPAGGEGKAAPSQEVQVAC